MSWHTDILNAQIERHRTEPSPEPKPVTICNSCGCEMYEGDVLYTIDGGICEECMQDTYKTYVEEMEC